ncbi:hypothetical protein P7K49_000065 [Saguinus oedipus]|uniref:Rab-GAP TBC domain-containing protein n=1 Tax=Saguinus oedipus TaxID=9490 RepID=A0ABQ9WAN0_SAGOE|nr:hypothetical protein P7K49_000065 [Saguinus oedipus]
MRNNVLQATELINDKSWARRSETDSRYFAAVTERPEEVGFLQSGAAPTRLSATAGGAAVSPSWNLCRKRPSAGGLPRRLANTSNSWGRGEQKPAEVRPVLGAERRRASRRGRYDPAASSGVALLSPSLREGRSGSPPSRVPDRPLLPGPGEPVTLAVLSLLCGQGEKPSISPGGTQAATLGAAGGVGGLQSRNLWVIPPEFPADLNRTFPDNVKFRRTTEPCLQKTLYNVLLAYGHHNQAVGYCQVSLGTL